MNKGKYFNKESINGLIIILTILQICIFVFSKYKLKDTIVEVSTPTIEVKDQLDIVVNELNHINNIKIVEIEDKKEKWRIETVIEGNNEMVISTLNKLSDFSIKNYTIYGEADNLTVNLELYR